jgi:thioesterase domain-containing protein
LTSSSAQRSSSTPLLVSLACLSCAVQMNLSSASLETAANNGNASVVVTNMKGLQSLKPTCGLRRVVVTDLHLADSKCTTADLEEWGSRVVGVYLHAAVLGPAMYVDPESRRLMAPSLEGVSVDLVTNVRVPASGTSSNKAKVGQLAFSGVRVRHTGHRLDAVSSTKRSMSAIRPGRMRFRMSAAKRKQVQPVPYTPPSATLPESVVLDNAGLFMFMQDRDGASYQQRSPATTMLDGRDVSGLLDAVHASLGQFVASGVSVRSFQFNAGNSSTASKRHVLVAVSPEMSQLESRVLLAKLRSAKLPIALVPSLVVSAPELQLTSAALKSPSLATLEHERAFEARTWRTLVHEAMGNSVKQIGNNVLAHGDGLAWERMRYLAKERFELKLPITLGVQCPTVESLVSALHSQEHLAATAGSVVPLNDAAYTLVASSSSTGLVASASAKLRKRATMKRLTGSRADTSEPLFLVHGHGGGVDTFKKLARRNHRPVFGLALTAEAPYGGTVEDYAAYLVDAVRAISPTGPYRIGGFSSGATLAYEMARQLQLDNVQVRSLLLLDQAPLAMAALVSEQDTAHLCQQRYDLALAMLLDSAKAEAQVLRTRMEREAPNPLRSPEDFAAWVLDQMGEASSATTAVQQMLVWSVHEFESIKKYARGLQARVSADEARGSAKKSFKLSAATTVTLVRTEGGGEHSVMRTLQTQAGGKHAHLAADFGLGALCTGSPVVVTVAASHEDVCDTRLVAELVQ